MNAEQFTWRRVIVACAVVALLATGVARLACAAPLGTQWRAPVIAAGAEVLSDGAPSLSRYVSRVVTRAEHSMARFAALLGRVGVIWLWLLVSAGGFLMIAAVSSVADFRMFELRRRGAAAMLRYFAHGARTFFRILRDRQTPYLARSVLAVALLYWLVPLDLIPDDPVIPGFIDDILIAISAAKGFIYLCPDGLIAAHAAAVESRVHASSSRPRQRITGSRG